MRNFLKPAVLAAAAMACSAAMADTSNLAVSATVTGVCKLQLVPAMAFSLDPSVGGDVTSTSTVEYKCTKNTPAPTVTLGTAPGVASPFTGTLSGAGTAAGESIAYEVTWTNPAVAGAGFAAAAQTFDLNGKILSAAYLAKPAGTYSASVPVNITP